MHSARRFTCLFAAAVVFAALPAAAELYTIKLKNGNAFESLYQPRLATEDGDKVLVATDVGNWISLPVDAIDKVVTRTEERGFGKVINTTTILIGTAPNDAKLPGQGEEELDPTTRLLNYFESQRQAPPPFNVQQFAEPNTGSGGIPLGFTSSTTPPLSGSPTVVEPPVAGDN